MAWDTVWKLSCLANAETGIPARFLPVACELNAKNTFRGLKGSASKKLLFIVPI